MAGIALTYYRTADGQMPADVKAKIAEAIKAVPQGAKVAISVTEAPPFLNPADAMGNMEAIIIWYANIPPDYADLDYLGDMSRLLSCYCADFSIVVGDLKRQARGAELQRKNYAATEKDVLIETGAAKSDAAARTKIEARAEFQELLRAESVVDGECAAASLFLYHAEKVLTNMHQKISTLKGQFLVESKGIGSQNA